MTLSRGSIHRVFLQPVDQSWIFTVCMSRLKMLSTLVHFTHCRATSPSEWPQSLLGHQLRTLGWDEPPSFADTTAATSARWRNKQSLPGCNWVSYITMISKSSSSHFFRLLTVLHSISIQLVPPFNWSLNSGAYRHPNDTIFIILPFVFIVYCEFCSHFT